MINTGHNTPYVLYNPTTLEWEHWNGHISEMELETARKYVPRPIEAKLMFEFRVAKGASPGAALIMTLSEYA